MRTKRLPSFVSWSVGWYKKLLHLYPKAYQREYGIWMMQLFRDQCNEAYEKDGRWGVARTWLRLLPDLGMTALEQHIEKFKSFHFMQKPNPNWLISLRFMALVLIITLAGTVALTHYWPREQICQTILELNASGKTGGSELNAELPSTESLARTEVMRMQSRQLLLQVIRSLRLADHYQSSLGGVRLSEDGACEVLRKHLQVQIVPHTTLIQIRVRDNEPVKAAQIANQIAHEYIEMVEDQAALFPSHRIDALKKRAAEINLDALKLQAAIKEVQNKVNQFDSEAVKKIRDNLNTLKNNQLEVERPYYHVVSLPRTDLRQVLPSIFPDTILLELLSKLNQTENELATLRKDYGPEAPSVQRISKLSEVINSQIETRIDGILNGMKAKTEIIRESQREGAASLEAAQLRIRENDELLITLDSKKKELQTLEEFRRSTQTQIFQEETNVIRRRQLATVLEEAASPVESILPSLPKRLIWGFLGAAGLYLSVIIYWIFQSQRKVGAT